MTRLPVLDGWIDGNQVTVWCRNCRRWHTHGYDPGIEEDGHRAAHCPAGPYGENGGYRVRIAGNWAELSEADRSGVGRGTDISGELSTVHETYRYWLGDDYDIGALDVVLCTAAAEKLHGDPPWLLLVGGSGAAKSETVMPLVGAGAVVISTISGEAALLSGTAKRERAKNASGGLLRKIGPRGLLVIKDVTSILSMNRDTRALVLAALREIYDGHWSRDVGTDGGQTLT